MPEQTITLWTLIKVEGDVRVRVSGGDWANGFSGQSFSSKHSASISTGGNGSLEVINNLGERIQIKPNSLVVFYGKTWSRVAEKVSDVEVNESEVKKALDALRSKAKEPQPQPNS